jgi:hypothetical protein
VYLLRLLASCYRSRDGVVIANDCLRQAAERWVSRLAVAQRPSLVYLLYLRSCAFKYSYILYSSPHLLWAKFNLAASNAATVAPVLCPARWRLPHGGTSSDTLHTLSTVLVEHCSTLKLGSEMRK